jgi:hypothetical protein
MLQVHGSFGNLTGPAAFATDGEKQLFQILFNATNYPYEEASYDGKKVYASRITPDSYSPRGEFVRTYGQILTEGLFGGTLSTAWALLAVQEKKPRLPYAGLKKVQGQELHRLDYVPRRGADLRIYLYFDPETFRHVALSIRSLFDRGCVLVLARHWKHKALSGGRSLPSNSANSEPWTA